VFIHCFFHDRQDVRDSEIMPLVEATLDTADPRTWYYALMDYGVMLKKTIPNPSRKSAHHTRQSRFEGSDRQVRGKILRLLLKKPQSRENDILRELQEPPERAAKILADLEKEGFIIRQGSHFVIAE
jgi:A/G-specific adenine glycosylase